MFGSDETRTTQRRSPSGYKQARRQPPPNAELVGIREEYKYLETFVLYALSWVLAQPLISTIQEDPPNRILRRHILTMASEVQTDFLVVGAGPAGAALACFLGQNGRALLPCPHSQPFFSQTMAN